jgi:hypothetical protein
MNAMNENEPLESIAPQVMAGLIDIRIKIDQFEDTLIESLEHIRLQLESLERTDGVMKALEELEELIGIMQEDVEEE